MLQHFASRLRSARKMSGLTLEGLADRLGQRVSKQTLNKYEQGTTKPDDTLLLPLCEALNIRPDYFSRTRQVEIVNYAFRKLGKLQKREQGIAIEKTRDALERYLELETLLGIEADFKREAFSVAKTIHTPEDAEDAANQVREAFRLGNDPMFNICEILEDKGIRVIEIDVDDAFNGMSTYVDDKVPVIVVNSRLDQKLDRKRFTLLHELAHLLLQFPPDIEEKQEERLCDAFAGALLLPGIKVKEMLGNHRSALLWNELVLIKELYGISIRAILYRARHHDIITAYDLTSKMAELSRFYGRKDEPGRYKGVEKAVRFRQLLLRGVAEEVISISKAAILDGKKLSEFRAELNSEATYEDSSH